jgi:hypothetical protein
MSREQVVDQSVQEGEASQSTTTAETYGLPAAIYAQVTRLGPGNVEGLKELLARYPNLRQGILSVASHHLGAATVRQAVMLTQDQIRPGGEFALEGDAPRGTLTQDQIRPGGEFALEGDAPRGTLTQDQIRPGGEFALEGDAPRRMLTQDQIRPGGEFALEGDAPRRMLTQDQIRPGGEFALEGDAPRRTLTQDQIRPGGEFALEDSPEVAPAPTPKGPEPAWVAGARRYNDAHADLVSSFNQLTNNSCIGADGQVDPQLVADWQRARGLDDDGKIGPMTVAAARQGTDARIPV